MKWKNASVFDCLGQKVFTDEYGLCTINAEILLINKLDQHSLYILNEQGTQYEVFEMFQNNFSNFTDFVDFIFGSKFGKPKSDTRTRDYYGRYLQSLNVDLVSPLKPKSVTIRLRYNYWTSITHGTANVVNIDVEVSSIEEMKNYTCWETENFSINSFVPKQLSSINDNEYFYLVGAGKVKVSKTLECPDKEGIVCIVTDFKKQRHNVSKDSEIYCLPYCKAFDIRDELNHYVNELKLSPFLIHREGVFNIYWDKLDEASCYHVIVYKVLKTNNRTRIIKIADNIIDRNTLFFSANNLVGGDFVFKVTAEDRNGNIVAESRGITSGEPMFFEK